jgi:D-arabinose 5-phosphate isomerase GutQ
MLIYIFVINMCLMFSNSKQTLIESGHGETSVVTNVSIVNKLFHQKLVIVPTKYMLRIEHNGTLGSLSNLMIKQEDELEEKKNAGASLSDILKCCVLVLILMFILMLLSEWTDLSVLMQSSRHHMVIIEM